MNEEEKLGSASPTGEAPRLILDTATVGRIADRDGTLSGKDDLRDTSFFLIRDIAQALVDEGIVMPALSPDEVTNLTILISAHRERVHPFCDDCRVCRALLARIGGHRG